MAPFKHLTLLLLLVLTTSVQSRDMESVLHITAEDSEALLSDFTFEQVIHIAPLAAMLLLGDENPDDTVFNINDIDDLPSTAAGNSGIINGVFRPVISDVRPLP